MSQQEMYKNMPKLFMSIIWVEQHYKVPTHLAYLLILILHANIIGQFILLLLAIPGVFLVTFSIKNTSEKLEKDKRDEANRRNRHLTLKNDNHSHYINLLTHVTRIQINSIEVGRVSSVGEFELTSLFHILYSQLENIPRNFNLSY